MTHTDTDTAQNKAVIYEFFARMSAGDLDGAFELLTDDCTWFSLSSRQFSSREHMRGLIERVNTGLLREPIVQTVNLLTAEDNRVAALTEGHAVAVSGAVYDQAYHFLFEFTGGRVSKLWEFNDTFHSRQVFALTGAG